MDLKKSIIERAFKLGFSLVGVASCGPLPHADVFDSWLERGYHGEMAYMATQRSRDYRAHPARLMPECRSVLVLGMRYPAPARFTLDPRSRAGHQAKIAAYAWGEDYHDVLAKRLRDLVDFIQTQTGRAVTNRFYTDTGPLLERELAQRAGLGWIGKNTCLINPHAGSYFFLAEILLGIELEPDPGFTADRCGSCTRCIEACPTGCILPDRTLDARRCISYLTIEFKGPIPVELRPLMDSWVFGCDVCQSVCPWNRFAIAGVESGPYKDISPSQPDLTQELMLSASEYNRRYRHTPIRRAGRRGYLRNVAVALGNLDSAAAVATLSRALLEDPEPLVRSHAAWSLGRLNNPRARHILEQAASKEVDHIVGAEIQSALKNSSNDYDLDGE